MAAMARRLSEATIADYANTYRKLIVHLGDVPIRGITAGMVQGFLAAQSELSRKTLLNYHIGLSALWAWAVREGLVQRNIMHDIPRPRQESREIVPFDQAEIRALLRAVEQSQPYDRPGKATTVNRLPLAVRNRAIILTLLDTGIRATELCTLRSDDLHLPGARLTVHGKGSKQRTVPFSSRTGQALWRYGSQRPDTREPYYFLTAQGGALGREDLLRLIQRIGERAHVQAHPHKFRHTFAITFLRNGGNVYVLQQMLGHTSLDMVRRYLHIVEADLDAAHRVASPVANWRL